MTQTAALLLSIVIEAPVAAALAWRLGWGNAARAGLAAALATAATHPVAWHGILDLVDTVGYWPGLLLAEGCVVLAESLAYRLIAFMPMRRCLLVSLAANAASTGIGLLLYAFGLA